MSLADLPPGEWTPLLIGDQWPSSIPLQAMFAGAEARGELASAFESYLDLLVNIKGRNLILQEGQTAETARTEFDRGIAGVRRVAEINRVKRKSYNSVHLAVSEFRSRLRDLAAEGNDRIARENNSPAPFPEKINQILKIVTEIRGRALLKSASCAGDISTAIREILTAQGVDTSPQAFAAEHGVTPITGVPKESEELKAEIGRTLGQLNNFADVHLPDSTPSVTVTKFTGSGPRTSDVADIGNGSDASSVTTSDVTDVGTANYPVPTGSTPVTSPPPSTSPDVTDVANNPIPSTPTINPPPSSSPDVTDVANNPIPTPTTPSLTPSLGTSEVANTPSLNAPAASAPTASPNIEVPAPSTASTAANLASPQTPAPLSPNDLAENFNTGNQTGAPASAGVEAITTAATSPVHTAPTPLSTPVPEMTNPPTPLFETAHSVAAPTAEVTQLATPPTEFSQPVVAPTPAAAIAPVLPPPTAGPVAMPPPPPPGSLLAYGADLRAPAAAAPPMPPATVPGSAPVNPAGGSASPGQPALVRQQPTSPPTQNTAPAWLTERAFAATATGAAAGALTARAAAESRLQRLLAAVARQQPKLRWAVGDLDDGSTVLVTDLAGGWVPPDIELPTGITLLSPADRRGDLTTLLGNTTVIAAYQPGQHLAAVHDAEPVATSIRARDTEAVDDLGWQLSQATKWRDGLPRLAHTLAKAVSARTGCLDSEVELLRDYLATVARTVIARYPRTVDPTQLGNWQLLATIDALINDEKTLANYHFAWFQAQVLNREGHR